MNNFRELVIWKKSIEIGIGTYSIARKLPKEEIFGLRQQITRASVSMASNIAEGSSRGSSVDFCRFLGIALGSAYELETQLTLIGKLNLCESSDLHALILEIVQAQKMISALIFRIGKK